MSNFNILSAASSVLEQPECADVYLRLRNLVQDAHPRSKVVSHNNGEDLLEYCNKRGWLPLDENGRIQTDGDAWFEPHWSSNDSEDDEGSVGSFDVPDQSQRTFSPRLRVGQVRFTYHGTTLVVFQVVTQLNTGYLEDHRMQFLVDLDTGSDKLPLQLLTEMQHAAYAVGNYTWVFSGDWKRSYKMYESIMETREDMLVLDTGVRESITRDTKTFFESESLYKQLEAPWQRGVLLLGPPGNGKTLAIRTTLSQLSQRFLVVRDVYDKDDIKTIFSFARNMAPCVLVLEDLDSLVKNTRLSYLLNELDGITPNHGLLIIATTNHPDQIDPALTKRPSRFDTKYTFDLPTEELRFEYVHQWLNRKYANGLVFNEDYPSLEVVSRRLAQETDKFSFSMLKELFISFALVRASGGYRLDPMAPVPVHGLFERVRALAPNFIEDYNRAAEDGSGSD